MDEQEIIINENEDNIPVNIEPHQINAVEATDEVSISDLSSEVRVDVVTEENIVIEEMTAANEMLNVAVDHSRYLPNQHTISAITGLRTELDNIEALQDTVYVQNKNHANYYLWQDENPLQLNREGLFVVLNANGTIKICNNVDEIFGVVVSNAGFIGGQDVVTRDHRYGLVSSTGLVAVQCESGVEVGDFVRSNNFGIAQNSPYGYKVVSISTIGGVNYATISLVLSATEFADVGTNVQTLNARMNNAETNIIVAVNVANEAYSIAVHTNENISEIANEALNKANSATDTVKNVETLITNIESDVSIARASAETAANIVANMREQTITTAETAMRDAQNAIELAENAQDDAREALEDARSTLDVENRVTIAEQGLSSLFAFRDNGYITIDNFPSNPATLNKSEIYYVNNEELYYYYDGTQWVSSATSEGLGLAESIAHIKQIVSENDARITSLAAHTSRGCTRTDSFISNGSTANYLINSVEFDADTDEIYYDKSTHFYWYYDNNVWNSTLKPSIAGLVESIAMVQQTADANESAIKIITSNDATDSRTLAYISAKADDNAGQLDLLTSYIDKTYIAIDSWNAIGKDVTKIYYAKDDEYYYYYVNGNWLYTTNPSEAGLSSAIAHVSQKADKNESDISNLTSFNGELSSSLTQLQQKSGADGSLIQSFVVDIDKYSVGEYSQAYGLTFEQAQNILELGMVYIPTISHSETYTSMTNSFNRAYSYIWTNNGWVESASSDVFFSGYYPMSDVNFWYVDSDNDAYGALIDVGVENRDINIVYYVVGSPDSYYYYKNGVWVSTTDPSNIDHISIFKAHTLYIWKSDIIWPSPNTQGISVIDGGALGGE